jgi:pilus assembly protein CpaE
MLLVDDHHPDLLIRAMRAGVREVLRLPLQHGALREAIDRLAAASAAKGEGAARGASVRAFVGCKGGSGATFVATNLGYALATLAGRKVLLVDLHRQFGDATLYVSDQKPAMTLADVCRQIGRVDAPFLESCLVRVAPGFGVLSGADDDPSQAAEVKPEHLDTILRVARQHYDDILLDLGRQIDAVSLRALDVADAIHPVLQMTLPDLRDARRLLDMFGALGYDAARVRLLVNRYDKSGRLRLADLRDALGTDAFHTIPNDYAAVADSVNQGVPLLRLARGSAAARSLADLVDLLTARRVPEPKRLFDRLFGARATIDQ